MPPLSFGRGRCLVTPESAEMVVVKETGPSLAPPPGSLVSQHTVPGGCEWPLQGRRPLSPTCPRARSATAPPSSREEHGGRPRGERTSLSPTPPHGRPREPGPAPRAGLRAACSVGCAGHGGAGRRGGHGLRGSRPSPLVLGDQALSRGTVSTGSGSHRSRSRTPGREMLPAPEAGRRWTSPEGGQTGSRLTRGRPRPRAAAAGRRAERLSLRVGAAVC